MKEGNKREEPCTSCKVISICCFVGIGGFLIQQGRIQPKYNKTYYLLGLASAALGFGEYFNKSPFRHRPEEKIKST